MTATVRGQHAADGAAKKKKRPMYGDVRDEIRAVAEKHQGDAVGYGETAWNADTSTVLYVAGDWTDTDPIEADMLALDGVDAFAHEAEALPDGWFDAEVVHPDDPAPWVTDESLALDREYEQILALSRAPLIVEDTDGV